jgi:hypothetical protein
MAETAVNKSSKAPLLSKYGRTAAEAKEFCRIRDQEVAQRFLVSKDNDPTYKPLLECSKCKSGQRHSPAGIECHRLKWKCDVCGTERAWGMVED